MTNYEQLVAAYEVDVRFPDVRLDFEQFDLAVFVNSFDIDKPSTATAKKALVALAKGGFEKLNAPKNNVALVAFSDAKEASVKSFRNIGKYHAEGERG